MPTYSMILSTTEPVITWVWGSMNPGITVLPSSSTCCACLPATARTSASEPTARILLPRIAIASASEKSLSTVRTVPPVNRMVLASASACVFAVELACPVASAPAGSRPKNPLVARAPAMKPRRSIPWLRFAGAVTRVQSDAASCETFLLLRNILPKSGLQQAQPYTSLAIRGVLLFTHPGKT